MARSILKPHASLFAAGLRLSDPLLSILAGVFAHAWYLGSPWLPERYALFLFAATLAILVLFPAIGLYTSQRAASLADEIRRLLIGWALMGALAAALLFATKTGIEFSRVWVSAWLAGSFGLALATRLSVRMLLRALRRRGMNLRHIAIIGAGNLGASVCERVGAAAWSGFNVVGLYDDDPAKLGTRVSGKPVLGSCDAVVADIAARGIDQVWIALPLRAEERIKKVLDGLEMSTVEVRFLPDIYGFHLLNHSLREVVGFPIISLTETPLEGVAGAVKRIEDVLLGALLLVAVAPLMAAIAIGIRLTSAGPVIYRQIRVTWNGEHFEMLKFRTMPTDAESASGPTWASPGDPRATPFGAFLRRHSLDELPQLVNVLRGEMSLVGPRPERPEFVSVFRSQIPRYMQKHLVKAGITGWAQVNDLRGDTDLRERIRHDLYYIENWSVWFDLRIVALTIAQMVRSRNAY